jgi:hypothetical protein
MLAFLALLPLHIYNYIAFLFILITLASAALVPGIRKEKSWSWIAWMFIPFLIGAVSWLWNGTYEKTTNFMGMYGVIAVWPLLFGVTSRFRRKEWEDVFFRLFIWATAISVVFYNAQLVYKYVSLQDQFEVLRQQHDFSFIYRTTFSKISGIHPTYFSLWIWISVALIGFQYRKQWKLYLIPLVVLLGGVLLLNSRMPVIAFAISFTPFIFPMLKRRQRIMVVISTALLFLLFGLSRFGELKDTFATNQLNSVNIRWQVWKCATDVITDGGFWGVGTGKGNTMLYSCYEQNQYTEAADQHLNSHNMYLHFFMENGWWGGVLFLVFIFGLISRFSKRSNSSLAMWFVLFFALCMLTENLFHRQPAVATFGLFIAIFAFTESKKTI